MHRPLKSRPLKPAPQSFVADHVATIPRSGIRDFFDIVQSMPEVISLGIGEPDFVTPWRIREAAIYALEQGKTGYTSNLGTPRLRRAITAYAKRMFNLRYKPETEVIVTVGVSEAIDLALRAVLNPGDEVLYHEPCYVSYAPSVTLAHGVSKGIRTYDEDAFKLRPDLLEAAITPRSKVLLMSFPTNPTGGVMSAEELAPIAALCRKHNLLVISDEVYAELTYEGKHTSIASLPGMRERTLFLHGFSKAYAMTGWRLGYACGPAPLIDAMMRVHQYAIMCASNMVQEAGIEALENGTKAMEEMREEYRLRRNFLLASFREIGLPCFEPRGAFYLFPDVRPTGLTSREFAMRLLEEEHVAMVPGEAFGPSGQGFIRASYATAFDQLEEAVTRIDRFVRRVQAKR